MCVFIAKIVFMLVFMLRVFVLMYIYVRLLLVYFMFVSIRVCVCVFFLCMWDGVGVCLRVIFFNIIADFLLNIQVLLAKTIVVLG